MESTESLANLIRNQLTTDFVAAELKWFWFRSALFSYKRDFLLRPFPPAFRKSSSANLTNLASLRSNSVDDDENKDFDKLATVAASIPPLSNFSQPDVNDEFIGKLSQDQIRLLAWVFDTEKFFRLSTMEKEMYKEIKTLTGQQHTAKVPEPDFVFRIDYDDDSENRFSKRRGDRKPIFAYHGSRLINFYSIVRNGLRANLNQVAAFGEGTYLSPELSVSLNWSPMSGVSVPSSNHPPASNTPPSTVLEGARLSCVAVCEVIDDPTGVSRCECAFDASSNSTNVEENNQNQNGRRVAANGVPDRYILVKNDDLLRIRYILAYVDGSNVAKRTDYGRTAYDQVAAFCNRHRFWLIMLCYVLLLSVVGLVNSNSFRWYVRRFWSTNDEYGYLDNEYPGDNFRGHGYEDT